MSSLLNRVLLVKKTTKYERLQKSGLFLSPYVENVLMKTWKEAADIHIKVAQSVNDQVEAVAKEVTYKRDLDLTPEDFQDKDLVLSLGGDGTFLKTASHIKTNDLPILGVNTDPMRSVGMLCNHKLHFDNHEVNIKRMLKHLERENFDFYERQRTALTMEEQVTGNKFKQLSLNEIFCAEKNISQTSIYRLKVDNQMRGKFKSSGIIISTGTGSTGWLYSARRITDIDVKRAMTQLGKTPESDLMLSHIAQSISDRTIFDVGSEKMYYYVRESCYHVGETSGQFTTHAQGEANEIEFISELLDGRVSVDGLHSHDIGLGDSFIVDTKPEYRLKCIQFLN